MCANRVRYEITPPTYFNEIRHESMLAGNRSNRCRSVPGSSSHVCKSVRSCPSTHGRSTSLHFSPDFAWLGRSEFLTNRTPPWAGSRALALLMLTVISHISLPSSSRIPAGSTLANRTTGGAGDELVGCINITADTATTKITAQAMTRRARTIRQFVCSPQLPTGNFILLRPFFPRRRRNNPSSSRCLAFRSNYSPP
jgi:hypothetical protein